MAKCTAHSARTGLPCKRDAIAGGTVCPTHGGRAPQVKKKAQERLRELIDPALAKLAKIVDEGNASSLDADVIRAANSILDRNRETAKVTKQELSGPDGGPMQFDIDSQIDDLIGKKRGARSRRS